MSTSTRIAAAVTAAYVQDLSRRSAAPRAERRDRAHPPERGRRPTARTRRPGAGGLRPSATRTRHPRYP
jgi:hypothetical protein